MPSGVARGCAGRVSLIFFRKIDQKSDKSLKFYFLNWTPLIQKSSYATAYATKYALEMHKK